MFEALGSEEAADNILIPDSEIEPVTNSGRNIADCIIKINGVDLKDVGIKNLIRKIKISRFLNAASTIELEFTNVNNKLNNYSLFKEGNEVEVWLGWTTTSLESHGTYIIEDPIYKYKTFDNQTIYLKGYNKTRFLSRGGMKRRSFFKRKDSEIAQIIATEYGLKADIEDTKVKYDQIVQANQNDFEFLLERAELYGFTLYVDRNTLHFHAIRFKDTGKKIILDSKSSANSVLTSSITLETKTFLQALKVKKEQLNWLNLDWYKTEDHDIPDPLLNAASGNISKASEVVPIQAIWYLVGDGHIQTVDELTRQTEKFSLSSRWITKIRATTVGLEFVDTGKIIRLETPLLYNGPYLITECAHEYNMARIGFPTYTTDFTLIRTFKQNKEVDINLTGQQPEGIDVSSNLASGSTVEIG